MRRTVTIHLRSTSTAIHHPQHAIALNSLRLRLRRLRLLPVCLPLWLQLPTPLPSPPSRARSAGDRSPNTLPIAVKFLPWPLPSRSPTGNQRCGCRLHCGIVVSALNRPTDRSRQTGTHLIPMSVASEQGTGTGGAERRTTRQTIANMLSLGRAANGTLH